LKNERESSVYSAKSLDIYRNAKMLQNSISLSVADALNRNNNNLDVIRLIAAMAVIYGHTFSIAPMAGSGDIFHKFTGHHSGSTAVKLFFFLSGLLVTNSLLTRGSIQHFMLSRFFRIWPGLAFALDTYLYFKRHILLDSWGTQALGYYNLPGVFPENHYKNTVNAPLWSIAPEVFAYLSLAGLYLAGLMRRSIATIIVGIIILDAVLPNRILFTFLPNNVEDFSLLPFCFAIGGLMALYKDDIKIDFFMPLGFGLIWYLFRGSPYSSHFFHLALFAGTLFFATRPFVIKYLKLPFDASYGTYLWGFPIQQTLAHFFPGLTGGWHWIPAMILSVAAGAFSWTYIEKRAMKNRWLAKAKKGKKFQDEAKKVKVLTD